MGTRPEKGLKVWPFLNSKTKIFILEYIYYNYFLKISELKSWTRIFRYYLPEIFWVKGSKHGNRSESVNISQFYRYIIDNLFRVKLHYNAVDVFIVQEFNKSVRGRDLSFSSCKRYMNNIVVGGVITLVNIICKTCHCSWPGWGNNWGVSWSAQFQSMKLPAGRRTKSITLDQNFFNNTCPIAKCQILLITNDFNLNMICRFLFCLAS